MSKSAGIERGTDCEVSGEEDFGENMVYFQKI